MIDAVLASWKDGRCAGGGQTVWPADPGVDGSASLSGEVPYT
jgi:hypothetical protein